MVCPATDDPEPGAAKEVVCVDERHSNRMVADRGEESIISVGSPKDHREISINRIKKLE